MITLAEPSTWIKLDRNILEWKWCKHPITLQVWLYLLLRANIKAADYGEMHILRGQVLTSHAKICNDLGLTTQQARTALQHLKSTGEITSTGNPKYSVITIVNYSKYQGDATSKTTNRQQTNNKQSTSKQQQYKNNKKEEEPKKNEYTPKFWELDIPQQAWGRFKSEAEWEEWKDANVDEVAQWVMS